MTEVNIEILKQAEKNRIEPRLSRLLPDDKITTIDQERPWRTVHKGSSRAKAIPNQRGQGARQS
jgi:hypothetical protein